MTENLFTNVEINEGTVILYFGKEHLECSDEGLKALLNDMNNIYIQQFRTQLLDSFNQFENSRMADLEKENNYLLKVMFAIKEYVENEDYENVIKAINKVSERCY